MEAYCRKFGLQVSQVHFTVNGKRIDPTDTAELLDLEDGDQILIDEGEDERTKPRTAAPTTSGPTNPPSIPGKVLLLVRWPGIPHRSHRFAISKSTPLKKLMEAYCSPLGLQVSQVHFTVYGKRIDPMDTAGLLDLEDGDQILIDEGEESDDEGEVNVDEGDEGAEC